MTNQQFRWGIWATGSIAATFAQDLTRSRYGILAGVGARDRQKAVDFCAKHGGTPSDDLAALLARDDIDGVYIATPHNAHSANTHSALAAGKPVLCEKPLGLNQGEVLSLYGAADRHNVLLVEALMYLMHPRMHLAKSLLDSGLIGEVTGFASAFGFAFPYTPAHRLYDPQLAGGGILDIGIYPLTAARYFLGEPQALSGSARLTPDGVDAEAQATLSYDGFEAHLHCAIDTALDWHITIDGTQGRLKIEQPWHPGPENNAIIVIDDAGQETRYQSDETRPLYAVEADHVAELAFAGQTSSHLVTPDFSINTAYWLDRWRQAGNVRYAADTLGAVGFHGAPVGVNKAGSIAHAQLPGLDSPVSKLVLGTDNQIDAPTMAAMGDAFVEAGGTVFDTAYGYSGGQSEVLLGQWVKARGLRDDVVILGKGAHPPDCTPEAMQRQLTESLDRLQTDHIDIYCLHRDKPDVPVGEWVDALNGEVQAGRISLFGGSNWTAARIDAANDYAAANGKQGFALLSNNFSLARMEQPVWPGCVASSENDFRAWHEARNMPLVPWSSQARGFFLDWERDGLSQTRHIADPNNAELQRVWVSPDNLERRRRAFELAARYQVKPIQIALAFVLHQPFPCFPIIGPRNPMQLHESVAAARLSLSAEDCAWLDLTDI